MRVQTLYTTSSVSQFIERYVETGGWMHQMEEGILGHGKVILFSHPVWKSVVITEVAVDAWNSAHKIRHYHTLPNKYQKLIEEL